MIISPSHTTSGSGVKISLGTDVIVLSKGKGRSANDQRSDAKNPTSSEHKATMDNRSNQRNDNNEAYHRSRESSKDEDDE